MRLVITISGNNYGQDTIVCTTIDDALTKIDAVDVLIYNYAFDEDKVGLEKIKKLFESVEKIYYVRNQAMVNYRIKLFVEGLGGKIIQEEIYMNGKAQLDLLFDPMLPLSVDTSSDTVTDFSKRMTDGESITWAQGELVVNASNELLRRKQMSEESEMQICQASMGIINELLNRTENTRTAQDALKTELQNQQDQINSIIGESEITDGVYLYDDTGAGEVPPVAKFFNKRMTNILLIRDLDRCNYLTSYVIGLAYYIENVLKLTTRVVFIENAGVFAQRKYKNYSWITSESREKLPALNKEKLLFTDYPDKNVIKTLVENPDYRITIFVDRTNYNTKHMLSIKGAKVIFYGVQSKTTMKSLKLNPEFCITSNPHLNCENGYFISYSEEYEKTSDDIDRKHFYIHEYEKDYNKILSTCDNVTDIG